VIGGILDVAGLGDYFLANLDAAEASMDSDLTTLAALAEHIIDANQEGYFHAEQHAPVGIGKTSKEWIGLLRQVGALAGKLTAEGRSQSDVTRAGVYLSKMVNRQARIIPNRGAATATLRAEERRARQRCYFFEVAFDPGGEAADPSQPVGELPAEAPSTSVSSSPAGEARKTPAGGETGNTLDWDS
jgi:hypothetical protein